ncbi:MAG: SUF system NifU family Fe-S cluster assembly protein [Chloroflexi bacterium]|nr:SUF system NifU family Fe-S cluster assembly protein [Chloroflexota bacterium]
MPQLPDVPLHGLYGESIMDHFRSPRHRSALASSDIETEEFNPFCGDRVILQIKLDDAGRITQVSSRSEGCSIIQATASMMAEALLGKSLAQAAALDHAFRAMMRGESLEQESAPELGDLVAMQVVREYPVRIKCALLPWLALEVGMESHQLGQAERD